MQMHKIVFRLRSPLITPLAADTLWGHIAWAIKYRDGERALLDWLDAYDSGEPPLVLSDPCPAGMLPVPALPPPALPTARPSDEEADAWKSVHKRNWMSAGALGSVAGKLASDSLKTALISDRAASSSFTRTFAQTHAAINRLTGGTQQEGGGTLFSSERHAPDTDGAAGTYEVYLRTSMSPDECSDLFSEALLGGYGKRASSGNGQIDVVSCGPAALPATKDANAVVLLGPACPKQSDPTRGYFVWGVRSGRIGGDYAIAGTPDGNHIRQKRPVRCQMRGTLLFADDPPATVGRLVSGVHEYSSIRHYAIALTLPCRLDPSAAPQESGAAA